MKRIVMMAAAITLGTAALVPAHARSHVDVNIAIGNAPPPTRYEVVPVPRHGYVWAPGYWHWNGRRHVWFEGHWERARPGHYYQRAEWQRSHDGWRLNRGGWQRGERSARHDHHVHHGNQVRRDRDGDGVPNRYDRRPNDPYRY